MSISTEEKKRYFAETALVLRREGFHVENVLGGQLRVWLDDQPLCEVSEVGGITYKGDHVATRSVWPQRTKPTGLSAPLLSICGRWSRLLL